MVASEMIRFKKSLKFGTHFELVTRLLGWDHKFFYIAHYFKCHQEVYALGLVKSCFIRKNVGSIDTNEVARHIGMKIPSPALPTWIYQWQTTDQAFFIDATKNQ